MKQVSKLTFSSSAFEQLHALKRQRKFRQDNTSLYPGASTGELQCTLNQLMNQSIDEIIGVLEQQPTKKGVLSQFSIGLKRFKPLHLDTEDRERVCSYYEEICRIVGITSTGGLLNRWLYLPW